MKSNEFDVFKIFYIIKKRLGLFTLFSVLCGIGLFLKFHFFTDSVFKSQFIVYTTVLESKVIAEEINSLEKLKEIKDFASISSRLNIEKSKAKSLKIFNAKELADNQKRMVNVTISGKDSTLLFKIPQLLEEMINNTPLYKTTAENYREYLAYEQAKIESELENSLNVAIGTNVNVSIRGTGELLDRKLKNSENIKNFRVFGVVGSNYISKPEASLKFNLAAAILGGIAAGLFFVLIIEFAQFVKNRVKEYED